MNRDFLVRQAKAAATLGHVVDLTEHPTLPGKWRAVCSCGYSSANRRTQALALGAGFHHMGGVVSARRAAGGSVSSDPGVSVPPSVRPKP